MRIRINKKKKKIQTTKDIRYWSFRLDIQNMNGMFTEINGATTTMYIIDRIKTDSGVLKKEKKEKKMEVFLN